MAEIVKLTDQEQFLEDLYRGHIPASRLPPLPEKTGVRMYLCSGGSDFCIEREIIHSKVVPLLAEYCMQNYGVEFQISDMHLGASNGVETEPGFSKQCQGEVERCLSLALVPIFVVMVGQKYGQTLPPQYIPGSEYELLTCLLKDANYDVSALEQCYKRNTNVIPNTYIWHNTDGTDVQNVVSNLLCAAAEIALKKNSISARTHQAYTASVLEMEITKAMEVLTTEGKTFHDHCLAYIRDITDLVRYIKYPEARSFMDFEEDASSVNTSAMKSLFRLRNVSLTEYMLYDDNHLKTYIKWHGISGVDAGAHSDYLEELSMHIFHHSRKIIEQEVHSNKILEVDKIFNEITKHYRIMHEKSTTFQGGLTTLQELYTYVFSHEDIPLLLCGQPGSGKTTTLCRFTEELQTKAMEVSGRLNIGVIFRALGHTLGSSNERTFLRGLLKQLLSINGKGSEELPHETEEIKNVIYKIMMEGDFRGLLVIVLDGIDVIYCDDMMALYKWLPTKLGNNVKVVCSSSNTDPLFMESHLYGNVVIRDFTQEEYHDMAKVHMKRHGQFITSDDWETAKHLLSKCATPFQATIVMQNMFSLTSNKDVNNSENSLDLLQYLFTNMEINFSEVLVSDVMSYITIFQEGITEKEIFDLLQITQSENKQHTDIKSYSAFVGLMKEISQFLCEEVVGGICFLKWNRKDVSDFCEHKYLSQNITFISRHDKIRHYALGRCGIEKESKIVPFDCDQIKYLNDDSCNRLQHQAMVSLAKCGHYSHLKAYLSDYNWLHSRLKCSTMEELLNEFALVKDRETGLIAAALEMAKDALLKDSSLLGFELSSRLLQYLDKHDRIKHLISQCDYVAQSEYQFVPVFQALPCPGTLLSHQDTIDLTMHSIQFLIGPQTIWLAKWGGSSQQGTELWDLISKCQLKFLLPNSDHILCNADGRYICVFKPDACLEVYRTIDGTLHATVLIRYDRISNMTVSKRYLAFSRARLSGPLLVDLQAGTIMHEFRRSYHHISIASNEEYLVCSGDDDIHVYTIPLLQRTCSIKVHSVPRLLKAIGTNNMIATVVQDGELLMYYIDTINKCAYGKTLIRDMRISDLCLSHCDSSLLVVSMKVIYLIRTKHGQLIHRLSQIPDELHTNASTGFTSAGFTRGAKQVVACRDTYFIVWDAVSGEILRTLLSSASFITHYIIAEDINKAATISENGILQVWDMDNIEETVDQNKIVSTNPVTCLAINQNATLTICSGETNSEAVVVDVASGNMTCTLEYSSASKIPIIKVQISPDGKYALTICSSRDQLGIDENACDVYRLYECMMWSTANGKKLHHMLNSKNAGFSNHSSTCLFVMCYEYDLEDITQVSFEGLVIDPTAEIEHSIELPTNGQMVCDPVLTDTNNGIICLFVMQICKTIRDMGGIILTRWFEIRLVQRNCQYEKSQMFRVRDLWEEAGPKDQFMGCKIALNGTILLFYCRDTSHFRYNMDGSLIMPTLAPKGVFIFDANTSTAIKHISCLSSLQCQSISSLQVSCNGSMILDNLLRVHHINGNYNSYAIPPLFAENSMRFLLSGEYLVGLSVERDALVLTRTCDTKYVQTIYLHEIGTSLEVAADGRTVLIGCRDGRIMALRLVLGLCDPTIECINKIPSRCSKSDSIDNTKQNSTTLRKDVHRISSATPELVRLSARKRQQAFRDSLRPPSYTILENTVRISQEYNSGSSEMCCIQ